ncbi:hypothetical protein LCGC14_1839460 [marine sediment metagenome]|uniref:Uncharacterized protein n=1 Tax=marine sediment metagenome TaxID=412755 RepID=A0A0F9JD27_9ZZZZ
MTDKLTLHLCDLYQIANVAVGYKRYDRLIWVANVYAKESGLTSTAAYKAIERAVSS